MKKKKAADDPLNFTRIAPVAAAIAARQRDQDFADMANGLKLALSLMTDEQLDRWSLRYRAEFKGCPLVLR
jgi:hypothetical protein